MSARIAVVKSDPSVGFPDFLKDNREKKLCSGGVVVTCPVFPKKSETGKFLLENSSCVTKFCYIWPIFKNPYNRS